MPNSEHISNNLPFVSVIIPCRNEAGWIARCLDSIIATDYPNEKLEVLVVDGLSNDGTQAIIDNYALQHSFIKRIDNAKQITPTALNIGVLAAKGDVIMRMDAHYEYPSHYISRLVSSLVANSADNVGGIVVMHPANGTVMARAIAVAVCHPFGVGNAYYRIGAPEPRWVDTVPFGCYRKDVFERIGLFDEELVRNQDIEFNLRLRNNKGNTLLIPDVILHGHARDSLVKMARMYYQYGYFNPLVIRKLGGRISFRQAVPPTFVLSLILGCLLASCSFWMLLGLCLVIAVYAIPLAACSIRAAFRHDVGCGMALFLVFPTLHISNGLGTLKGIFDFLIIRKRIAATRAQNIPITR